MLLVVFAIITILAWIFYRQYHSEPQGWVDGLQHLKQTTAAHRVRVAEALEDRVVIGLNFSDHLDDFGRPQPNVSSTRTLTLTTDEINAWLDQRLEMWMKNRNKSLPKQISKPVFWTDDDRAMLGLRVQTGDFDHVVSLGFTFEINDAADDAAVYLDGAWIGELRVPLGLILDPIREKLVAQNKEEEVKQLDLIRTGKHFPPTLEVNEVPYSRIRKITVTDAGLEVLLEKQ